MPELIVAMDSYDNHKLYNEIKREVNWYKLSVHSLLLEEYLWQKLAGDGKSIFWDLKLYDTRDTLKKILDLLVGDMVSIHTKALEKLRTYPTFLNLIQVNLLTDDDVFDSTILSIADGIVCPVNIGKTIVDKITICPGIRLNKIKNNHKISFTPKEANHPNIDYIVVGRPIYLSQNPLNEVCNILNDLT